MHGEFFCCKLFESNSFFNEIEDRYHENCSTWQRGWNKPFLGRDSIVFHQEDSICFAKFYSSSKSGGQDFGCCFFGPKIHTMEKSVFNKNFNKNTFFNMWNLAFLRHKVNQSSHLFDANISTKRKRNKYFYLHEPIFFRLFVYLCFNFFGLLNLFEPERWRLVWIS